jgi:hypothetical protein
MAILYADEVDLRDVKPARMRAHLACIVGLPDGAGLVVHVGANRAEPEVCRLLAEHAHRLDIAVYGRNEHTCGRWRSLILEPDVLLEKTS